MADDPTKRGAQDRERSNVNERHELEYWSKKLGITQAQLKDAVAKVGVMAKDVAPLPPRVWKCSLALFTRAARTER
jgi:Protein of unknown function (DUF3606)